MFKSQPLIGSDYRYIVKSDRDTYSLEIPEVFEDDAGLFSVIAENNLGKVSSQALVIIDNSPKWIGNSGRTEKSNNSNMGEGKKTVCIQSMHVL